MKWTPEGESKNIEDRRGQGGFGSGGVRVGIGGAIVLLVLSLIFGRDFVSGGQSSATPDTAAASGEVAESAEERQLVQFVSFVLDDVQDFWSNALAERHVPYEEAKLVLFRDQTPSGCGMAVTTMGPFYCPLDQKVYIDLAFYEELRRRFGAPGDFAQAYVIAHELGHHVQHLLGVEAGHGRNGSVPIELQADCL